MKTRTRVPNGTGRKPWRSSFQESSIATGTTGARGAAAMRASVPCGRNGPRAPSRARVPSGKITAETPRPATSSVPEPPDRLHRIRAVAAVDERVAAPPQVVGDARDPALRELPLGDELQVVPREHRAQDRDVEHALVVRDEEAWPPVLEPARALHERSACRRGAGSPPGTAAGRSPRPRGAGGPASGPDAAARRTRGAPARRPPGTARVKIQSRARARTAVTGWARGSEGTTLSRPRGAGRRGASRCRRTSRPGARARPASRARGGR